MDAFNAYAFAEEEERGEQGAVATRPAAPAAPLDPHIVYVATPADTAMVFAWLRTHQEVALDCEATGKDPLTASPLLLQLGDADTVFVLNLPTMLPGDLARIGEHLAEKTVIGHNLDYDYRLLRRNYALAKWTDVYDTQLAEQMLTMGDYDDKGEWLKNGLALKILVSKYLGLVLDKEERASFIGLPPEEIPNWEPTPEQIRYAALDVAATYAVAERQVNAIELEGLWRAYDARRHALVPIAEVELRGMRIDVDSWRAWLKQLETELAGVEVELAAILDPYEQQYRLAEYERKLAEKARWEQTRDAHLAELRQEYDDAPHIAEQGMGWGEYKTRLMGVWRQQHPNPGTPRLDTAPINLNSNEQIKRAYKAMGVTLPTERDPETGKVREVCDAKARKKLLANSSLSSPARKALLLHNDYSKLSRLLTGFGENLLSRLSPMGRLHTSYNIGLTETGRMSSENPNFQNMPKREELRHCFIADEGYLVITADFKSQELFIAAGLSGDTEMQKALAAGRDLYKEVAVEVFGVAYDDVTKEQRAQCKNGLLGVCYGLTAMGMERQHGVPEKLAQQIIDQVKASYPVFFRFALKNARQAMEARFVTTALGAKRYFRDRTAPEWKVQNEGRNAPIQGTAADIVYTLAARLEDNAVPYEVYPLNFVHDEVVAQAPAWFAEDAAQLVREQMQLAFLDVMPYETYGVVVDADVHVAPYWSKE